MLLFLQFDQIEVLFSTETVHLTYNCHISVTHTRYAVCHIFACISVNISPPALSSTGT